MIGDRDNDMVGAKGAEVTAIGVLWGYGDREELQESGADIIVETPEELYKLLNDDGGEECL